VFQDYNVDTCDSPSIVHGPYILQAQLRENKTVFAASCRFLQLLTGETCMKIVYNSASRPIGSD